MLRDFLSSLGRGEKGAGGMREVEILADPHQSGYNRVQNVSGGNYETL